MITLLDLHTNMSEEIDLEAVAALRKKRQFKKFTYRGLELEKLLDMSQEEFTHVVHARARRRLQRGLKRRHLALLKKLRAAKAGKFIVHSDLLLLSHFFIFFLQPLVL